MKILLFAIKAFDFVYYKLITIFDEIVKQLFKFCMFFALY